jgi:spore coat protein H
MYTLLILVSFASCHSEETPASTNKYDSSKENAAIYIYADTIGWGKKLPCTIFYHGKEYSGEVKYRGGMSSQYPKHSMTVELDGEAAFGGLKENDDWIFNASYIDKTFQRHKLSYDLFRKMDRRNKAPECAYVQIHWNDKPIGLYVVMEKVNGSWLGFDKNQPNGARLYKDPFVFIKKRLPNVQEPHNYYQQKFPKVKSDDFNGEMDLFKEFLFSDDTIFKGNWKKWVNEANVIDWHLLLLLTNNDDGVVKNFYMYRNPGESQYYMVPWDYDHAFGRDGNYELNLIEREVGWDKSVLLKRLMQIKETGYADKLRRRYWELRKSLFTESNLLQMISENESMVRPHIEDNKAVWSYDTQWYLDDNSFDEEMDIIKRFIPIRLEQLDHYFYTLEYGEEK